MVWLKKRRGDIMWKSVLKYDTVSLEETKNYLASIDEKSNDGPATISALKLMIKRWDAKDNTFDPAVGAAEIIRLHKKKNE